MSRKGKADDIDATRRIRHAELDAQLSEDSELVEALNLLARDVGLPPVAEAPVGTLREWTSWASDELGLLPPIHDKRGVAAARKDFLRRKIRRIEATLRERLRPAPPGEKGNDSLLMGYLAASLELGALTVDSPERRLLDDALVSSRRAANKREKPWRFYALALARHVRNRDPGCSQKELVGHIERAWEVVAILKPVPLAKTQLAGAIRAWERDGEIPRRRKN